MSHVNPLAVSVQANGEKELILDLRHVYKQKFNCENLHTIKNTFAKGFFVFSFDLKSGYHHVAGQGRIQDFSLEGVHL